MTAGSSGGSAAAVAANLGEAALGTDTGNSIRGPSAHQALVGIRSTMGLTSRDGVAPLSLAADIAGPIARTVADAVALFQVVAGEDAADTVTARSRGHRATDYATSLTRDALRGARIGVLRQAYERPSTDPEVVRVFTTALEDMRRFRDSNAGQASPQLDQQIETLSQTLDQARSNTQALAGLRQRV